MLFSELFKAVVAAVPDTDRLDVLDNLAGTSAVREVRLHNALFVSVGRVCCFVRV